MAKKTLLDLIEIKIKRSSKQVFCRKDFSKLGGYDQVGRALRTLVKEKKLIKVGYGLYAKARINRITEQPMLNAPGGFLQVCQESLNRLKVNWKPSNAMKSYAQGSTQLPARTQLAVTKRFNRKISYKNQELKIQRGE